MKYLAAIIAVAFALSLGATVADAKGGGSRGGSFGGSRSSSVRSSSVRTSAPRTTSAPKVSTPKPPKAPKPVNISKPSANTQTKVNTTAKKVNGKSYAKKGYVVGDGYQPRFTGGYVAPMGSTVYYQNSMWDWFPMYYILTHSSQKQAVVVAPDGKEQVVKEEGKDSMFYINWILTIILGLGLIAGLVYLFNKFIAKK